MLGVSNLATIDLCSGPYSGISSDEKVDHPVGEGSLTFTISVEKIELENFLDNSKMEYINQ